MKKVILGLIIGLVVGLSPANAFERLNFGSGYIADNANVVSLREEAIINAILTDLHKKTTADLAVVTVKSLQGQNVEERAMYIAKAFKVGAIGKDNGAVLLIAPNEKKVAIYTGFDFNDVINDPRKKQIEDHYILHELNKKDGNISQGVYKAASIIAADIGGFYNVNISNLDYTIVPHKPADKSLKYTILFSVLSAILFLGAGYIWYIRKTKDPDFGGNFGFGGDITSGKNW